MNFEKEINKININIQSNQLNEAMRNCNHLIKKFPKNSYIYNLGGLILQRGLKIKKSIDYFRKSLELDSHNDAAKNNLANSYKTIGKFEMAIKLYEEILKNDNKNIKCLNNYANLKQSLSDNEGAILLFEKALLIDPNNLMILFSSAHCYQSIGKFNKAIDYLKKILLLDPNNTIAHRGLSTMTEYNIENNHLNEMLNLSKSSNLVDEKKTDLFYALGKAFDDIGDHEKSFMYVRNANQIKKKFSKFNLEKEKEKFSTIKDFFSKIDLEKRIFNNKNKKIIFICGMPRSGTTLVEQIIASHNKVDGAGELDYLNKSVIDNLFEDGKLNKQKILEEMHMESSKIEDDYHKLLEFHKFKNYIITDKAVMNFKWLGIIKIFFNNSKIIHCTRNPKDICLSIYKNLFSSYLMDWSYSEEDIGNFYILYKDLMKFWTFKLKDSIYNINYENLIRNKNTEVKKLLDFCELDLDENCFNHHRSTKTPIKTVSISQARSQIYSSSINKNEYYKKNLQTMFNLIS